MPIFLVLNEGYAGYSQVDPFYQGCMRQCAFPLRLLKRAYLWVHVTSPFSGHDADHKSLDIDQVFLLSREPSSNSLHDLKHFPIEVEAWVKTDTNSFLDDSLSTKALFGLGFITDNEEVAKEAMSRLLIHKH
jgi:hypothetical protein